MRTRGFTLVEMVVVIAVLAVVMAMAVPRMFSRESRVLQLSADRVADLLTMYAQRESLSSRPSGISHDTTMHRLVLMVLDAEDATPEQPAQWRPDRTVKPVQLPPSVDIERGISVSIDGTMVDISRWPVATEPGKRRPRIEISLFDNDGRVKTLVLPSHALKPYDRDDTDASPPPRLGRLAGAAITRRGPARGGSRETARSRRSSSRRGSGSRVRP